MSTILTATPATEPADRIGELRTAIDACDAEIIELVERRLAISREIGALRAASGGTRLSLARGSRCWPGSAPRWGPTAPRSA